MKWSSHSDLKLIRANAPLYLGFPLRIEVTRFNGIWQMKELSNKGYISRRVVGVALIKYSESAAPDVLSNGGKPSGEKIEKTCSIFQEERSDGIYSNQIKRSPLRIFCQMLGCQCTLLKERRRRSTGCQMSQVFLEIILPVISREIHLLFCSLLHCLVAPEILQNTCEFEFQCKFRAVHRRRAALLSRGWTPSLSPGHFSWNEQLNTCTSELQKRLLNLLSQRLDEQRLLMDKASYGFSVFNLEPHKFWWLSLDIIKGPYQATLIVIPYQVNSGQLWK